MTMDNHLPRPPRIPERLLLAFANRGDRSAIAGDVAEEFTTRVEERGLLRARLWYVFFVARCFPSFLSHFVCWSLTMFKNYLTIALRIMKRHKTFSFINIGGLAVGMACSTMIALYILHEVSFDRFHENADRIYRITADGVENGEAFKGAWTAPPMAAALLEDFPEIEKAARYDPWPREYMISHREKSFMEGGIQFADASFFEIYSFPFIYGEPSTALEEPGTVVLTLSTSLRYFGHENPLGKTLAFHDRQQDFTVTGVIEDPPPNSHFQFHMIASLVSTRTSAATRWMQHTFFTYILLREGVSVPNLEAKFPDFIRRHYGPQFLADTGISYDDHFNTPDNRLGYRLEALTDLHLNKEVTDNLSNKGNPTYLLIFSTIAAFILLIACINFMNLATARFVHRSREVGIRKVLGSHRRQLVHQFLGESLLLSFIATALAIGLIAVGLPAFSGLAQRTLSLRDLFSTSFLPLLGVIAIGVGLIAGSYPAFFLSSFKPQTAIKGWLTVRGKGHVFLRRGLVLLQFAITFGVVFSTAVIARQVRFLQNRALGFDKERVVVIHRAYSLGDSGDVFESELRGYPEILNISRSESLPGRHFDPNGHRLEGRPATDEFFLMTTYVDPDFADLLGLEVIEGRFFSRKIATDATSAVVINERAARELGLAEPVGKRIHKEFRGAKEGEFVTIIGVLRDFHFDSLHREIQPMLFRPLSDAEWAFTSVKVRPEQLPQTLALIEKTWKKHSGDQPFKYSFLDTDFDALYNSERRVGKIFSAFSILAIWIACLGLFGLVSFAAEQRTREIGIRKTFGASVAGLTGLLSKEVLLLVGTASLLSAPLAYYFNHSWLANFAFRSGISPLMFLLTAGAVLAVAFLSVAFRALRAASAIPVETLRYE